MEKEILISVVIPVKNGDFWLDRLLQGLVKQTLFHQAEIIVIDSGSTDRSLEIIGKYPVRLIRIPAAEFNHGDTRNLGVKEARGKYVVMTVQDAVPASDLWLQHFVDGFKDEKVVALCGQQIVPHEPDKNPVWWFRPVSSPQKTFYHYEDPAAFLRLSPAEQRQKVPWDNVVSAYRREILLQYPFPRTDFAEDIIWAREILVKGRWLGNIDEARVFHYHHYRPEIILPRYFSVYYFEYKTFGLRPQPVLSISKKILSAIKILLKEPSVPWPEKYKWLIYNIRYWKELKKTVEIFNTALDKGESILDDQYREICKKPPQALKY
jgi:rhamnosyltransferase